MISGFVCAGADTITEGFCNVDISVIIPTYDRGNKIFGTLEGLLRQTIPPDQFEVIIVDDGSSDDTKEQVQGFLEKRKLRTWKLVVQERNGGSGAATNAGIRMASNAIVLFIDDDIVPVPAWVESHLRHHTRAKRATCVVGAVKYPDEWVNKSNLVRYHNSRYLGQKGNRVTELVLSGGRLPPSHFAGGNSSLPKKTFVEVGMYNDNLRRGHDNEFAIRLVRHGVDFVFEPKAEVIHYADAVFSYNKWLQSFQTFYIDSAREILERYPEEYYHDWHWFVERPKWGKESFKRSFTKTACRTIAQPRIGRIVAKFLESIDATPFLYQPALYKYVLTCAAIDAINKRT